MASFRKEILIKAHPDQVWAAVRDVGTLHERLAQGFVIDTRLDGDARLVTFANGLTVRELFIDIDDETRRFAYTAVGGQTIHQSASMRVFANDEDRSRLVWITDVLPNDLAGPMGALVEQGTEAIK